MVFRCVSYFPITPKKLCKKVCIVKIKDPFTIDSFPRFAKIQLQKS